jgi:hypothetical protein
MTLAATRPCYVFAVVDADTPDDVLVQPAGSAVGDVRIVRVPPVAAVVGTLDEPQPLGRAADLRAHDAVVAALVGAGVAVLPLRFGAVLADERAVVEEFLPASADTFAAALDEVRGCAQFTVTVRYDQDVVLRELLARDKRIAALHRPDGTATAAQQIQLGELVVAGLTELGAREAPAVVDELAAVAERIRTDRPSGQPDQLVRVAALVRDEPRFVAAVEELGRRSAGRLRVRLVGPVAPYDFVPDA